MVSLRSFTFPSVLPTWHLGHMAKAIRHMKVGMKDVDVVIETRDARLPLTSINPMFEKLFRAPPNNKNNTSNSDSNYNIPIRLIVYNKKDLADHRLEQPLREAFKKEGQVVFFTNSKIDDDVKQILSLSKKLAYPRILSRYGLISDQPKTQQPLKTKQKMICSNHIKGIKIMFCGMPNVGKSSLLNAMRRVGCHKGKAASVASMPGHTRSIGGLVKISDGSKHTAGWPVYAFDTPGIMIPYLGQGEESANRAFKMAITAVIKDSLFDPNDLAAYLFHTLLQILSPTEAPLIISKALQLGENSSNFLIKATDPSEPLPIEDLLFAISNRIKAVKSGGTPDLEAASQWLLKCFRDGRFGGQTLDHVGQETNLTQKNLETSIELNPIFNESSFSSSNQNQNHQSSYLDFNLIHSYISNYLISNQVLPQSKTSLKLQVKQDQKIKKLKKIKKKKIVVVVVHNT